MLPGTGHRALPVGWLEREVVRELIRLWGQVAMAGSNVNQIARALNSGGVPGGDLEPEQPIAALGRRAPAKYVWHCVLRAAPGDPELSVFFGPFA